MPSVAEQSVVRPVCRRSTDADHGNPVHKEHNQRKDRKAEPAVGYDFINLVGLCQTTCIFLLVAGLDNFRNINIALVGDDALRIVIQLLLGSLNVLLDVVHRFLRDIQLL